MTLFYFLYIIPALFCLFDFSLLSINDYFSDKKNRDKAKYYIPTLTVGVILMRIIASIIPFVNIAIFFFECFPRMAYKLFNIMNKFFNIPLVPKKA